ncbi:glycogen synthase GlgA [Taklimakanibacter lacteus]|uniref:glycogen synthase GlgA n=1 Tax=Taklimakanibacter lacteus TaxID=2268456 RepID=UPI0034D4B27A
MKILAVASEVFPLVKTGGLADVAGALPAALKHHGAEMRVMMPAYPKVMAALEDAKPVHRYEDLFGGPARLLAGTAAGLDLLALDAPHLFDRSGNPYTGPDGKDWPDNWMRFAALSRAAADAGRGTVKDFAPDIVHAHDWQAALAPAYLHFTPQPAAKTVLTVHNIAFQGQFSASIFPALGLPEAAFSIGGVEYYGDVGFLKGGLNYADAITTVSPSYSEEIRTPDYGMGLDGLLRARRDALTGIVNGIDTDIWNPASDAHLALSYVPRNFVQRRLANKRAVEERLGLEQSDGLLFCVVSRLTWQKGMDILAQCLDGLVAQGARLALLGSGDAALENDFREAAEKYPGRIAVKIGYDEGLSHLLQGGADAILIPSRFEPCGLTQLYGLRYGCVPVVSRVGGLADTVVDANEAALDQESATGVQFAPVDASTLARAIERATRLYADRKAWNSMQKAGMKTDVSWEKSAARYAQLYQKLLQS